MCVTRLEKKKTILYNHDLYWLVMYLSPVEVIWGRRDGIPDIWEESFDFAAVCCWTLTSAASAKCIKVFLSGLSSKFLHPIHLQELEHIIFAWNKKFLMKWCQLLFFWEPQTKTIKDTYTLKTRNICKAYSHSYRC